MSGTASGVILTQNGDDIDIELLQGLSVNFTFTYGGACPIDITDYTAQLLAAKKLGDAALVSFTVGNGRVAIDGTQGLITFSMTAADSADLTPFTGVYEARLISPTNQITEIFSGAFSIIKQITA